MLATGTKDEGAPKAAAVAVAAAAAAALLRGKRATPLLFIKSRLTATHCGPPGGGATKGLCVVLRNLRPKTAAVGRRRRRTRGRTRRIILLLVVYRVVGIMALLLLAAAALKDGCWVGGEGVKARQPTPARPP